MQTEDGFVTMDEVLPEAKKLLKMLRDIGFFAEHAGQRILGGGPTVYCPNLVSFWHRNTVIHADVVPGGIVRLDRTRGGRRAQMSSTVCIDAPNASFELKKVIDDFFSYGVVVDEFGDKIFAVEGGTDATPLDEPLGHETCGGRVWLQPISKTHKALVCEQCHLRVPVGAGHSTIGLLRLKFKSFNS